MRCNSNNLTSVMPAQAGIPLWAALKRDPGLRRGDGTRWSMGAFDAL